jgi:post-segregation antitoxin (ccd killing protein)
MSILLRIGVLMQYLEKARQAGLQISPEGQQAIMARMDQLLGSLRAG